MIISHGDSIFLTDHIFKQIYSSHLCALVPPGNPMPWTWSQNCGCHLATFRSLCFCGQIQKLLRSSKWQSFFATQSNFSPSLLLPSSQMGWHCYQLSLLAPFHWILIRRKKDLSFCLQGYQINMNIGSSNRLGKTCRPCRPFVATTF